MRIRLLSAIIMTCMGISCTPPPATRPASEPVKAAAEAAVVLEAVPGPEHNVFVQGNPCVVRVRVRNTSGGEVRAPIQCTVTDFRGKEIDRKSVV